jgi:hypothetical protein
MKKLVVLLTLMAAVVFGFYSLKESRRRAAMQSELATAEQKLAESLALADERASQLLAEHTRLREANTKLAEKANDATLRELAHPNNATTSAAVSEGTARQVPDLFKDPDMKETLQKQSREAVARNVKQFLTTNLIQRLGLNEQQAATLRELLLRKGTLGFDFMTPVMTGELDEAALGQLGRQTKAAFGALELEVRSLLGEEGFKTFDWFERSQPERERVQQFASQLVDVGQLFGTEQQDQLLALMYDERQRFPFATDYSDTSKIDFEHFRDFYSEARMENYFSEMEQLNVRIVQRAQTILAPEQVEQLRELLRDQVQKGKFVVRTTNALLGQRRSR